jgi:hypothetical protein
MRIALSILFGIISTVVIAQTKFPALSSKGSISQVVGFTTITVDYERPAVRSREIFGELVPFGEVWRTGAGKCTRISFSDSVFINNRKINAGIYSLFTIPGPEKWTIILNSDTSLYGAGKYDSGKDVIRFVAKPEFSSRFYESFTIDIDVVPNNAMIYLSWEKTQVRFRVDTGADQKTVAFIDEILMSGKSSNGNEYAAAVEYYLYQNKDLDKASTLTDLAIARNSKESWYHNLKIDLLERQRNYKGALLAATKHVELLEQHGKEFGWDEQTLRVGIAGAKSRAAQLKQKVRN